MTAKKIFVSLLVLLIVAGHFYFLMERCPPSVSSPDANGYFAQAELIATHGRTALEPASPLSYIGLHWLETPDGQFFSRYPPGMGFLLAIPYVLFGPDVAIYMTPLLGSLSLLFLFLLCRPRIGDFYALCATLLFAVHPVANQHAMNWGAHTVIIFLLTTGLYLVDSWSRNPTWIKVALAGLLLGTMPTVRYAEVVAGLGVAGFLLYHVIRSGHPKYHLLVALGFAALPIAALMARNYSAFGSPFDTGYALTGEQQAGSGFSLEFFEGKWRPYLQSLMGSGVGLFFALGLAGLIGMWARKKSMDMAILLTFVILPITGVYCAYYWGGNQMDSGLRFLLPTLPLYLLPAFWFLRNLERNRIVRVAAVALVLMQVGIWVPTMLERTQEEHDRLQNAAIAVKFLREEVPSGSVLVADRRLQETLQFYPNWELVDASVVSGSRGFGSWGRRGSRRPRSSATNASFQNNSLVQRWRQRRARGNQTAAKDAKVAEASAKKDGGASETDDQGPPDGPGGPPPGPGMGGPGSRRGGFGGFGNSNRATPMQRDKARKLRKRYEVADRKERGKRVAEDLLALADKKKAAVYWIGTESTITRFEDSLPEGQCFEFVKKLEIPRQERGQRRGRFNMRRMVGGMFGLRGGSTLELYKLVR